MKKLYQLLLATFCFFPLIVSGQITFSGGNGSAGNPYQITTANQLAQLALYISQVSPHPNNYNTQCYILMNNLDLTAYGQGYGYSGTGWLPIGSVDVTYPVSEFSYAFKGTFDGNNKTISNLWSSSGLVEYGGLFGFVSGGTVKNITVTNAYVRDIFEIRCRAGAVVARIENGTVTNCHSSGQVISTISGNHYSGGVVGYSSNSTVSNCSSSCSVQCTSGIPRGGGVVGYMENGTISGCSSTGTITITSSLGNVFGAGIVGLCTGNVNISNSYSTGTIYCTGASSHFALAGGIAGDMMNGTISKCYSTGAITATNAKYPYSGGIIGLSEDAGNCNISNCYSTGTITVTNTIYGTNECLVGGIAGYSAGAGIISNCYATGAVKANTGTYGTVYLGGIVGIVQNKVQNCAALNPSINASAGGGGLYFRVAVLNDQSGSFSNNVGFNNMLNAWGNTNWEYIGLNNNDGADITASAIHSDGTLGGRFTTANGWTIQNGKLPGFGASVNIPAHITAAPPQITTTSLPGGVVGTSYNQTLTVNGDTPITWSLASGNLPNGLTISSGGTISGTPTTGGTFNFSVKATNSAGSDTKSFSIIITTTAVAPTITTNTLPNGMTSTPYSAQLTASGTAPITWSLTSGNLPNGLTLSTGGTISGTPTTSGTFNFTVRATNSAGNVTKSLTIKIESVGVVETDQEPALQVYPNPTTGELKMENGKLKINNVEIFDINGRKQKIIFNSQFSTFNSVDISHLPAGVYFLRIDGKMVKVVKQ